MWTPDISRTEGPRYLAIAVAIAHAIETGELAPGAQLPPQRDLAQRLGVTVGTISRAYAVGIKRHLLRGDVGRGTFVLASDNGLSDELFMPQAGTPAVIDFRHYNSSAAGLADTVSQTLLKIADRPSLLLHRYPPAAGFSTHRAAGTAWIGRTGFDVGGERVIIVGGAQQALQLALLAFCNAGDVVLTEDMTYAGLKAQARIQGLLLHGVATDEQGMLPEQLDAACRASGARILYIQPTVHNPTGASMPEPRRREIANIAQARDLLIIEDDAAASALLDRPPPIATLLPDQTCYITSMSKSVGPSLRIAYVAAPPMLLEQLTSTFHVMALAVSALAAEVATLMIGNGTADEIARLTVNELRRRQQVSAHLLGGQRFRAHPSGYFLWLELPSHWCEADFVAAATRSGVSVAASSRFAVGGTGANAVRLSVYPGASPELLQKGLDILVKVMRSRPDPKSRSIRFEI